jgi:hypothetical protein
VKKVKGSKFLVKWRKPVDNGGSRVTGYTVTCSNGQVRRTRGARAVRFTVKRAVRGTEYTFTVTAVNISGASLVSNPTDPIER